MCLIAYMQCYSWLSEDYNGQIILIVTSVICVIISTILYSATHSIFKTNVYIFLCVILLMGIMHYRADSVAITSNNLFLLIFVLIANLIGVYIGKFAVMLWNKTKNILLKR